MTSDNHPRPATDIPEPHDQTPEGQAYFLYKTGGQPRTDAEREMFDGFVAEDVNDYWHAQWEVDAEAAYHHPSGDGPVFSTSLDEWLPRPKAELDALIHSRSDSQPEPGEPEAEI